MAFGTATAVTDPDEKLAALDAIVDHMCPGRGKDVAVSSLSVLAVALCRDAPA